MAYVLFMPKFDVKLVVVIDESFREKGRTGKEVLKRVRADVARDLKLGGYTFEIRELAAMLVK